MKPLATTVEEVLLKAIESEVESRAFYQKLAERAATAEVRKRLLGLADDELVHRARLERKFRDRLGREPLLPAAPKIDIPDDVANLDLPRALKLALERERDSESYFRFMAERAEPGSDLLKLFMELAEMEWKHKTDLQAEYDAAAAAADPEKFLFDF